MCDCEEHDEGEEMHDETPAGPLATANYPVTPEQLQQFQTAILKEHGCTLEGTPNAGTLTVHKWIGNIVLHYTYADGELKVDLMKKPGVASSNSIMRELQNKIQKATGEVKA